MATAAFTRDAILPNTISVGAGRSRQKRSPSVKVAIVHEHTEYTDRVSMLNALTYTLHFSSLLC